VLWRPDSSYNKIEEYLKIEVKYNKKERNQNIFALISPFAIPMFIL